MNNESLIPKSNGQAIQSLIITADDYGMSENVNRAIEACMETGTVRATCVMTNMPAAGSATSLRKKFPQSSLGIHWTITDGFPLSSPKQIPSLVGPKGGFHPFWDFRRKWLSRQIDVSELKDEMREQYFRFTQIAGAPAFWNTHQDFHVFPGLYMICVKLARELQIPAMRCHRHFTVPHDSSSIQYNLRHPLYYLKGWAIDLWAEKARKQGMLMPDGKVHMVGYQPNTPSIGEVMMRLPWNSISQAVELTIHPAISSQVEEFHKPSRRQTLEYQTFSDSQLPKCLEELGITSVGFEVLNNSSSHNEIR